MRKPSRLRKRRRVHRRHRSKSLLPGRVPYLHRKLDAADIDLRESRNHARLRPHTPPMWSRHGAHCGFKCHLFDQKARADSRRTVWREFPFYEADISN